MISKRKDKRCLAYKINVSGKHTVFQTNKVEEAFRQYNKNKNKFKKRIVALFGHNKMLEVRFPENIELS